MKLSKFGYLLKEGVQAEPDSLITAENVMENRYIRVKIRDDGSIDMYDKRTGRSYVALGVFEDVGDVGDEYVFQQAIGEPITTKGVSAKITVAEDNPARAAFRVEHVMKIPASADAAMETAIQTMEQRELRQIGRSEEMVELKVAAVFSLAKSAKQVEVRVEADNNAKDHRLRILFPTDLAGDSHYADSVFDVVKRTDIPGPNWVNPSRCDHMQMYAAVANEKGGLAAANRGLYEYEILDDRRTLAVTLLRAVGEVGDWGVFPTPEAQCLGAFEAELALIPLTSEKDVTEGFRMAHEYQIDLMAEEIRGSEGMQPMVQSFLNWSGEGLICTCFKAAVNGGGMVFRAFNASDAPTTLSLQTGAKVYRSNILEERGEAVSPDSIPVGVREIVTVIIEG